MARFATHLGAVCVATSLALGAAFTVAAQDPDLLRTPPPELTPTPAPALPSVPPELKTPAESSTKDVDPERLAAARDLLQATNTDAQFSAVIPMMFTQLKQSIPSAGSKMQEELDKVFEEIQKEFIDRRQEVLDQIAILYARKFTADEMKGVADFYRSELGQKFIAAIPELTGEAMRMGNVWGRQIAMDAEKKVREEMRRRGFDL